MQVNSSERSVRLSVRELAIFRNQPTVRGHGRSPWRAAVGQQWHQHAEDESRAACPEAQFEVSVSADWRHHHWVYQLNGRIDQLIPRKGGFLIREVKTIRSPLPAADESLIELYAEYFAQAAIYLKMLSILPEYADASLEAEVQFINIENGARQSVTLQQTEEALFERQLDQMRPFLEERRASINRLAESRIEPAFESLREGQSEFFKKLREAVIRSRCVLAEAPTGFGKTGIVLEHALKHMQAGHYERCIYLSSKSTGQLEVIRQLRQMTGDRLRYIQMRNRLEHRIESEAHTCTGDERCESELDEQWKEAELDAVGLFADGTLSLERAREVGARVGICPYTLTKACLPYAEVWIGDSNYVFGPESRPVFLDSQGFDPARTLLIVDEAHNLPERAASSLSMEISEADLLFAIEELRIHGAPRRLLATATELARWLSSLSTGKALNSHQIYLGQDLCEDFTEQLKGAAFDYESTANFALKLAWSVPALAESFNSPNASYLHWAPRDHTLAATCLDASHWIAECIQPFGGTILMSATLKPFEAFRTHCGLEDGQITIAEGHAPWRDTAYDVAIDCRVDTRLRARERHYETTARTVAQLCHSSPGVAVAVFFASYLYADNIKTYLEALHPEFRVNRQPRAVDLAAQESFIQEGLLTADALFLILGSSYAEGIDQLGGRVDQIMIVGPALPEVNLIQQTKMEQHPSLAREQVFADIYIQPAMRKIHQALGRIVRAPGQSARVLLHGKRFSEPAYYDALAAEYQTEQWLRTDADLSDWLREKE